MSTTDSKKRSGLNRRQFVKWTGIGAGGVALTTLLPFSLRRISRAEAATFTGYVSGSWTRSCCNMCGGQCGVDVYVEGGRVRKIEPPGGQAATVLNPNNVANVSTSYVADVTAGGEIGRLCCKGNSALASIYDPDRLTSPMMRVGPRGGDDFVPISWDEAIAVTAARLQAVRSTYGARSLVWFGEDHSFTHPQQDFCDAFGTPNYCNHSNLCDTSRKSGWRAVIGDERPLADMENTDLLLVFGWNFLSAIKWVHLTSIFTRARMRNPNFEFIYLDPVFNTTASKATKWIAPRPGTDGAIALAVARLLIADGRALDTAFIDGYTLGYDEYRRFLYGEAGPTPAGMSYGSVQWNAAPYSGDIAAWAAAVSGVPATDIQHIADRIIAARTASPPRKVCIDFWSGPGHHSNAHMGGRAIACLNLLIGAPDAPGAMLSPLRSGAPRRSSSWGPAYSFGWPGKDGWRADGKDDVTIPATYAAPDGPTISNPVSGAIKKKYAYSHGSGIYVEMIQRMLEQKDFVGNPYPIKACAVVFQNLMMNVPNSNTVKAALEQMDFVFVVDTHMSETARMADIVFPGAQYLERNDVNANWVTFRSIGYRQQVVPPWFGGMTEWQLFLELGAAMGFNGFKTAPENSSDEAMQTDEWAHFLQYGTGSPSSPSPWNNQMSFAELKTSGTWIETSADPSDPTSQAAVLPLIPASTDGAASTPKGGTHYRKYKKTSTGAASVETLVVGAQTAYIVRDSAGKRIGITTSAAVPASFEVGFGTDSRFGQFWDPRFFGYWSGTTARGDQGGNQSVAGDVRFHPLPWFSFPDQAPAWLAAGTGPGTGTYPLFFLSWKEVEHTHTRTFNNAWLMEMKGENRLLVHPTVAGSSIREGDWVWVQTPFGIAKARAHVTYGIQPECVGWVRGFGHWALGSIARGKGAHDNALLPSRAELHSGQAVNKEVACRIYKEV